MVFITLKLNVFFFKKSKVFYCFCSVLSNCYHALLWIGPMSFLVKYKINCLVSVLSEAILVFLLILLFKTNINFLMLLMFVVV